MPPSKPLLALAINIDGPTLVPHMVKPMANQPKLLLARNKFPSFFLFPKLAQAATKPNITK